MKQKSIQILLQENLATMTHPARKFLKFTKKKKTIRWGKVNTEELAHILSLVVGSLIDAYDYKAIEPKEKEVTGADLALFSHNVKEKSASIQARAPLLEASTRLALPMIHR